MNSPGPCCSPLLYGIAEVINGVVFQGYDTTYAFKILVFNINPVYIFLGAYVSFRHPGFMRALIRFTAWSNGGLCSDLFPFSEQAAFDNRRSGYWVRPAR